MTMLSAIRKAVMADPVGGSALIDEVVYSYLSDQAEEMRPEIEQLIGDFVSERILIAKQALGKSYVAAIAEGKYPDESIQKNAQWIADLEFFATNVRKDDLEGSELYEFNRKHPRGPGGRFRRGITPYSGKGHPTVARPMNKISPTLRNETVLENDEKEGRYILPGIDEEVVHREQHQYEEANKVVNSMLRNFSGKSLEDINVVVNLTDGNNPSRKYSRAYSAKALKNAGGFDLDPSKLWNVGDIINDFELEAKSGANEIVQNQINAYNTLGNTGNAAVASLATVDPERLKALGGSLNRLESQRSGSKLSNFFNRLSAGGNVMQQVPGMEKYGDYARFVGTLGPQAEEALGPYVQQAAYRYRGTEKEPDLELIRSFNNKTMQAVDMAAQSRSKASDISDTIMRMSLDPANRSDITLQAAAHEINHLSRTRGGVFTPDELSLNVRADVAAHHLLTTLPDDPFVAQVSAKSGHILPSQGVIIDADGDIVSQSVGFSDDHYLPFDLKNLKSLRGGQYVRTRQQGGITGEDIYTSIRTGARMATVVSSSGIYSIEFDPNFRGARANSDKARSMYERYLKILDSIEDSKLYVKDIPPAEKAQLRAQAQLIGDDPQETLYNKFLDERREASKTLDSGTIAILQEEAAKTAESEGLRPNNDRYNRRVEEIFDELSQEKLKERVSQLSLNSKGYDLALKTLQQQFPYFIRNVSYQPLTSKQEGEGFLQSLNQSGALGARQSLNATDQGYVNPGGLRPESMRRGYYKPSQGRYNEFKNKDFYSNNGFAEQDVVGEEKTQDKKDKEKTGTGAGASASPKSKFLTSVESFAGGQKEKALKAVKNLDSLFSTIITASIGEPASKHPTTPTTWNDIKDGNDVAALTWLLHPGNGGIAPAYNSDPERVAALLSNEKAVKTAVSMYKSAEGIDQLGEFGDSTDEMAAKILETGKELASASSFINPFVEEIPGTEGIYYTGNKPQAFKDLNLISDEKSLNEFLHANPGLANAVSDLKEFKSDSERVENLKEYFDAIKLVKDARQASLSEASSGSPDSYSVENILRKAGIDGETWRKIIGNKNDLEVYGYNSSSPVTQFKDMVLDQRAKNLQNARSILAAQQMMSVMSGGEESPKAVAPLEPEPEPTEKSLKQAYSSQRVQIVSKNHPLAREIQLRKSLNLPLVSKKSR